MSQNVRHREENCSLLDRIRREIEAMPQMSREEMDLIRLRAKAELESRAQAQKRRYREAREREERARQRKLLPE
jgi:hypothetical protein